MLPKAKYWKYYFKPEQLTKHFHLDSALKRASQ